MSVARFAWGVLVCNIGVILWGAYVRASGSGAGCGSHWPLCNGEVIPREASVTTLIEFSHRLTSGLALLLVVALLVWTRRATPPRHPARQGALWSLVFMLTEAAVGAGLVLLRLVADNASIARAMFMAVHLVNTFILIAWLALTAWWLSGGAGVRLARRGTAALVGALAVGLLATGMSGAVAALGDTLFPAGSLRESLAADLSATSHVLVRLRVLHPAIAIASGLALALAAVRLPLPGDRTGLRLARLVAALVTVQLAAGLINVILLAPVWMQMVHLLLADAVWIAFVLLGARALAAPSAAAAVTEAA